MDNFFFIYLKEVKVFNCLKGFNELIDVQRAQSDCHNHVESSDFTKSRFKQ